MSLAGSFLVARPTLHDPNFSRAVVLLLAHTSDGAFGVVVNRPVSSLALPFPVFDGGPCPSPGVVILHGHPDWVDAEAAPEGPVAGPEAAPGIFIGDASCLSRAAKPHPGKTVLCRVYRGFAGWEGGQLERELADGVWGVVPANGPLLFDTPSEELWDRLAPPAIPQPSLN